MADILYPGIAVNQDIIKINEAKYVKVFRHELFMKFWNVVGASINHNGITKNSNRRYLFLNTEEVIWSLRSSLV